MQFVCTSQGVHGPWSSVVTAEQSDPFQSRPAIKTSVFCKIYTYICVLIADRLWVKRQLHLDLDSFFFLQG